MIETVRVRPWPGLILAEVPPEGADLPTALAEEWIADRLVVRVPTQPDQMPPPPVNGPGSPRARKRKEIPE
jgi:hypothetical protein